MSDDFEPLDISSPTTPNPAPTVPLAPVKPREPIQYGTFSIVPPGTRLAPYHSNPAGIEQEVEAEVIVSGITGLPMESVSGNLEPITEELYGEVVKPAGVIERFTNTLKADEINRKIAQLRARQFAGDVTPETQEEIERLQANLANPDEQMKGVPRAIIDFLYNYGYALPRASVEGSKRWEDKTPAEKIASGVSAFYTMTMGGWVIGAGKAIKDVVEQSIGTNYGAMIDNGVDPTVARVTTGVLSGIDVALSAIPFGSAAGAGARTAKDLAGDAVGKALVKGTLARVAVEATKQTAMAAGQATAVIVGQEIAAAVSNAFEDTEAGRKAAGQILSEIGIQTVAGGLIGTAMAGSGVLAEAVSIRKNSRLDLAVQEATLKAIREAEPKVIPDTPTAKPVEPSTPDPGKQLLKDTLYITDEAAEALDFEVRSSEGSADYVPKTMEPGTPAEIAKAAIADYRSKMEARARSKKLIDDISRIDISKLRPEYAKPIKEIMDQFTPENFRADTIARLTDLRNKLTLDPDFADYADIPRRDLERLGEMDKTSLSSLSVDDLQTIRDTVVHYAKLAQEAHFIKVGEAKMEIGLAVEKAVGEIGTLPSTKKKVARSRPGISRKALDGVQSVRDFFGTDLTSFDLLAQKAGDTTYKVVFDDVHRGNVARLKYSQDMIDGFNSTIAPVKEAHPNLGKWLDETATVGEVIRDTGERVPLQLSRSEKMALYMHSLNDDNRRHLLEGGFGFKWAKGERNRYYRIEPDTFDAVVKSMTPEEKLFCDAAAAILKQTGKDMNQTHLDITDTPLQLTDDYYHIDTMPMARGADAESEMAYQIAKQEATRVGLTKGMLKERTESKIPIYLNPITYDLAKSLDWAAAYVNLEKPLRNASRLMTNKTYRLHMTEKYGDAFWKDLNKGLKDIAGQRDNIGTLEAGALKLRNKMSTAMLGINVFTIAKQPIALLRYGTYVKSRYLMAGMVDTILHNRRVMKSHALYSPEWVNRTEAGFSREVADVMKAQAPGSEFGAAKKASAKLMGGIKWADKETVSAGMQGAVAQALDEFKSGKISPEVTAATGLTSVAGLSPEQKMALAYKFADWVTERTQAMSLPEFQSTMQRGTPFAKMFTLFGSEQSAQLNLRRRVLNEAKRGTPGSYKRVAKAFAATLLAEPLAELFVDRLRNAATGREQQDIGKDVLAQFGEALVGGYPIFRDLEHTVAREVIFKMRGLDDSILPLDKVFDTATDAVVAITDAARATSKSKRKAAMLKSADLMAQFGAYATGLPYIPAKTMVQTGLNLKKKLEAR